MNLWSIFCKNLKHYRYENGYSQEKLGELSDLSARYISAIECGRYSPTFDTLEKIAKALQVEPYQLFKPIDNYEDLPSRIDIHRKKVKENNK